MPWKIQFLVNVSDVASDWLLWWASSKSSALSVTYAKEKLRDRSGIPSILNIPFVRPMARETK